MTHSIQSRHNLHKEFVDATLIANALLSQLTRIDPSNQTRTIRT